MGTFFFFFFFLPDKTICILLSMNKKSFTNSFFSPWCMMRAMPNNANNDLLLSSFFLLKPFSFCYFFGKMISFWELSSRIVYEPHPPQYMYGTLLSNLLYCVQ